jgi:hypothetical protein
LQATGSRGFESYRLRIPISNQSRRYLPSARTAAIASVSPQQPAISLTPVKHRRASNNQRNIDYNLDYEIAVAPPRFAKSLKKWRARRDSNS